MTLTRQDLLSLEQYSERRATIKAEMIRHKATRRVRLGDHLNLIFEDRHTIRYQIQEMLRIEKIFESAAIEQELGAYNALIPDGSNWKCTLMIEYEDVDERRTRLTELVNIEDSIWVEVAGHDRVLPITNEDLQRSDESKTSAVHFLRYELTPDMISTLKHGARLTMGVDHLAYGHEIAVIPEPIRQSLMGDLQETRAA